MPKKSLKLIIDASVARASGNKEEVPVSTLSRKFLEEFMKSDNILVMTHEIYKEWGRHESKFAKTWRSKMIASKKMEVIKEYKKEEQVRGDVEKFIKSEKVKREILKDLHLIDAAMITDQLIVSNDNKIRGYLTGLSCNCSVIKEVVWVNPTNPSENGLDWLKNGCPRDPFRKIGYFSNDEAASS